MESFFIEDAIEEINTNSVYLESMSLVEFAQEAIDTVKRIIIDMQERLKKLINEIASAAFKTKVKLKAKVLRMKLKDGEVVELPDFGKIFDLYENECHNLVKELKALQKRGKKVKTEMELQKFENACMDFEDSIDKCTKELEAMMEKKVKVTKASMNIIDELASGKCRAFNLYADVIREIERMAAEYDTLVKKVNINAERKISAQHRKAMSVHLSCIRRLSHAVSSSLSKTLKRCVFIITSL